jgi:hypothetical protein
MEQIFSVWKYRVFHGFWQAKLADGGTILGSSQFTLLPQLPLKKGAQFKSGQNQLENNRLASLIK